MTGWLKINLPSLQVEEVGADPGGGEGKDQVDKVSGGL